MRSVSKSVTRITPLSLQTMVLALLPYTYRALEGGVQNLDQNVKIRWIKYQNFKCNRIKISELLYENVKNPGSNIKISNLWIRISEGWIMDQMFKNGWIMDLNLPLPVPYY